MKYLYKSGLYRQLQQYPAEFPKLSVAQWRNTVPATKLYRKLAYWVNSDWDGRTINVAIELQPH